MLKIIKYNEILRSHFKICASFQGNKLLTAFDYNTTTTEVINSFNRHAVKKHDVTNKTKCHILSLQ